MLNRVDTASTTAVEQWKKYLMAEGGLRADNRGGNVPVFFVDSKRGRGVHEVRGRGTGTRLIPQDTKMCSAERFLEPPRRAPCPQKACTR